MSAARTSSSDSDTDRTSALERPSILSQGQQVPFPDTSTPGAIASVPVIALPVVPSSDIKRRIAAPVAAERRPAPTSDSRDARRDPATASSGAKKAAAPAADSKRNVRTSIPAEDSRRNVQTPARSTPRTPVRAPAKKKKKEVPTSFKERRKKNPEYQEQYRRMKPKKTSEPVHHAGKALPVSSAKRRLLSQAHLEAQPIVKKKPRAAGAVNLGVTAYQRQKECVTSSSALGQLIEAPPIERNAGGVDACRENRSRRRDEPKKYAEDAKGRMGSPKAPAPDEIMTSRKWNGFKIPKKSKSRTPNEGDPETENGEVQIAEQRDNDERPAKDLATPDKALLIPNSKGDAESRRRNSPQKEREQIVITEKSKSTSATLSDQQNHEAQRREDSDVELLKKDRATATRTLTEASDSKTNKGVADGHRKRSRSLQTASSSSIVPGGEDSDSSMDPTRLKHVIERQAARIAHLEKKLQRVGKKLRSCLMKIEEKPVDDATSAESITSVSV